jgi:hypothetical protein
MLKTVKSLAFLVGVCLILSIVYINNVVTEADSSPSNISVSTSGLIQRPAVRNASLWLHTQGTKILNETNQELIWNGIDSKTLFGYWTYASGGGLEEFLHASDVQIIRSHGLNTIRLDIALNSAVYGQAPGTPTLLNYYPRFWQLLDELVLAGEQNGLWIKINFGCSDGTWANIGGLWGDGNGFPKWMYDGTWPYFNKIYTNDATGRSNAIRDFWNLDDPTAANVRIAFQTFWKDIVYRYKDSPCVVFSIFNEPQNQWGGPTLWDGVDGRPTQTRGAEMYRDFMEQTVDAIRDIDGGKHLIVINEAYFWSYATNLKVNRPNIVVESHSYSVIDQSFVNLGWRYEQPFILGEFGGVEQGGLQDRAGTIANMQSCNSLGVSWLYLNYDITRGYPSAQTWTDIENNLNPSLKH